MTDPTDGFVHMWEWFATHCHGYSPLYERIALAVAGDRRLIDVVRSAPSDAHLPPALLAAAHYLLLDGADHPLADVYAGRSLADPGPLFLELCHQRESEILSLLTSRHIQTNECGRSSVIGPGITWVAAQWDRPLALVDVGASAGINLLCDQFLLDYGDFGATGPTDSTVRVECHVAGGRPPIARHLPEFVARVGIDRSPVDLSDPDDARWLLACVWPDTGRLERTAASIALAQRQPPEVVAGDANEVLPEVLAKVPGSAMTIVLTTWAFAYFPLEQRTRFVEILEAESHHRQIAWLSAEGSGTVELLNHVPTPEREESPDLLGVVPFDHGIGGPTLLASVQEHGSWIEWHAPPS